MWSVQIDNTGMVSYPCRKTSGVTILVLLASLHAMNEIRAL